MCRLICLAKQNCACDTLGSVVTLIYIIVSSYLLEPHDHFFLTTTLRLIELVIDKQQIVVPMKKELIGGGFEPTTSCS